MLDYCCTKEKAKCNFSGQRKKRRYIFEPNNNEQECDLLFCQIEPFYLSHIGYID
ncbi:hypothetical protein Hanom_Chr16g01483871 [Helianthus anomalus]